MWSSIETLKGVVSMKIVLGIVIGGIIGFGIGYFGRCATGVCLLTSNPIVSTIVGALFGLLITVSQ